MRINLKNIIGFLGGIIVPIITFFIYYKVVYGFLSVAEFYTLMTSTKLLSPMLSLCVIPNLLLFFIFFWTHRDYEAKGTISATLIYAFIIMYLKFIA
jgi:hypothetical protein